MFASILFWLLMVLWLMFGAGRSWWPNNPVPPFVPDLLLFVLFLLVGLKVFGLPA